MEAGLQIGGGEGLLEAALSSVAAGCRSALLPLSRLRLVGVQPLAQLYLRLIRRTWQHLEKLGQSGFLD